MYGYGMRMRLWLADAECVLRDSMRAERSAFYFSFRFWFAVFPQLICRRQSYIVLIRSTYHRELLQHHWHLPNSHAIIM